MTITYDTRRPSTAQLHALYDSVGWSLYLRPGLLDACLDGSTWFECAWSSAADDVQEKADGASEKLVGLVRVVGDDASIAYVQDLLVDPDHQRAGVGSRLLDDAGQRFSHVRQLVLLTDDDAQTRAFYESAGLVAAGALGCVAYLRPPTSMI